MNQDFPSLGRSLEETKRVSRILELVQMIAISRKRYLRRDLADHFEISERTIQKDLDVIRHGLKLSLVHSQEGYYFEEFPQLPTLQFSFAEALALLLVVQAAQQVSGIGATELAPAVARLKTLFPQEFAHLLHHIIAQPMITVRKEHRQQMLLLLNQALVEHCKVRITYETRSRGGNISERIVHPYHLMPYVRSWQLIAYCERRHEPLIFKVDRILEATLLYEETRYRIPNDFSLEEYLGATWGMMRGQAGEPVSVRLHFSKEAGSWVSEEHWHPSQSSEILDDESVLFSLYIAITPEFVNWLMYYGDRVKVLEPVELRERLAQKHLSAATMNR
ncbi:MAG: WYL domain-containing protein [Ardenticatenales bacterium]|nr:WYL domain-containing protein [Ardenticatenales bacterium]